MIEAALQICKINDDCSTGGRLKRGLCRKHYERWLKHGDVSVVLPSGGSSSWFPRGEAHPDWTGDTVGYFGMHKRIEAVRGKASSHGCINGCLDASGIEWAYTHDTDSRDVMNYRPMCKRCHHQYDTKTGLTWEKVEEIRALAHFGLTAPRLGKMYNVSASNVKRIVRVETWVPEPVCTEAREIAEAVAA